MNMISKIRQNTKGFTLIELLLYTSLAAILLTVISLFLGLVLEARVKNQTVSEVEQQGTQIIKVLSRAIRNAEDINSPNQGSSSSTLSLDATDSAEDPTVFDLSGNNIRIKEGGSSTINLTSNRIDATNLEFTNVSRSNTPGIIRIEFTLEHNNPSNRNEYDFSQTFYESVSLR